MPYTANELARASGKTVRWIQHLCKIGIIPAKRFGNAYSIEHADAQKYLDILKDIADLEENVAIELEINGET